jgi:hypothetical protein
MFTVAQEAGISPLRLEHRFSNRGTKEKSAQSEVNNEGENRVNAYQPMLIATSKP